MPLVHAHEILGYYDLYFIMAAIISFTIIASPTYVVDHGAFHISQMYIDTRAKRTEVTGLLWQKWSNSWIFLDCHVVTGLSNCQSISTASHSGLGR